MNISTKFTDILGQIMYLQIMYLQIMRTNTLINPNN